MNERFCIYIVAILLIGCSAPTPPAPRPFHLSSPRIVNGKLSTPYDAKGQIVFPDLQWENPPSGTKSLLLIMENRGRDILAWYYGKPRPDKTGLSRGDFETLQNGAGISWTDVSKASTYDHKVHDSDEYDGIFQKIYRLPSPLPSTAHQFMAFVPGMVYEGSRKTKYEYRITLFALDPDLEDDWNGVWGENTGTSLRPIKSIANDSINKFKNLQVLSDFRKILEGHIIDSKELTFTASY